MTRTLVKHGDSLALVLDQSILDSIGAGPDTQFEITASGKTLSVIAVPENALDEKIQGVYGDIKARYASAFQKLAE